MYSFIKKKVLQSKFEPWHSSSVSWPLQNTNGQTRFRFEICHSIEPSTYSLLFLPRPAKKVHLFHSFLLHCHQYSAFFSCSLSNVESRYSLWTDLSRLWSHSITLCPPNHPFVVHKLLAVSIIIRAVAVLLVVNKKQFTIIHTSITAKGIVIGLEKLFTNSSAPWNFWLLLPISPHTSPHVESQ